ncbi:hypothetical protein F4808DRAFT_205228 [Astrocystis sublimbata]|nr:hypothetical protein F4808DRAFT_205228 [Astrocystis sublimbata]
MTLDRPFPAPEDRVSSKPKANSSKLWGTWLSGCVVAIADKLDEDEWRSEKVRAWVEGWGGRFLSDMDDSVTHLLCTEEKFKKKILHVQKALKNKGTKIVMNDWLEDSINKKAVLRSLPYQLDEKAKKEAAKERKAKKNAQCAQNALDYVDERFWHVYSDTTYFRYQVELKRNDPESGNVGEKHLLTLWQSNPKPMNYLCTTIFTKRFKPAIRQQLNESPVDLAEGLKMFEAFFKKRTGISWDDRIEKMGTTGPHLYQYQPPSGGKPLGLIKGRPASIFGNKRSADSLDTLDHADKKEEQVDHSPIHTNGAERPAKRPRLEAVEETHVADHNGHDSGYESEADAQGVQPFAEILADEAPNEAQDLPDINDVVDEALAAIENLSDGQPDNDAADDDNHAPESVVAYNETDATPYHGETVDIVSHHAGVHGEEAERGGILPPGMNYDGACSDDQEGGEGEDMGEEEGEQEVIVISDDEEEEEEKQEEQEEVAADVDDDIDESKDDEARDDEAEDKQTGDEEAGDEQVGDDEAGDDDEANDEETNDDEPLENTEEEAAAMDSLYDEIQHRDFQRLLLHFFLYYSFFLRRRRRRPPSHQIRPRRLLARSDPRAPPVALVRGQGAGDLRRGPARRRPRARQPGLPHRSRVREVGRL